MATKNPSVMLESPKPDAPKIDIGLPEQVRKEICDDLANILADTYTLYLKTHYYHWNITGGLFQPLHEVFEQQYMDLWQAVDTLAERMRILGAVAPGTYTAFHKLTKIEEDEEGHVPKATDMLRNLVAGHETAAKRIRKAMPTVEKDHDQGTLDLYVERLRFHEKTAWMMRSFLG